MSILEFILNNNDYLEDLITRSTYHSNAIEGSTLTYAETYAILYNDNSFKIGGKEPREIYEAINHKKALELVFKNLKNNDEKVKTEILDLSGNVAYTIEDKYISPIGKGMFKQLKNESYKVYKVIAEWGYLSKNQL